SGLLDGNLPPDFAVPEPTDVADLMPDELPLEAGEDEEDEETGEEAEPDAEAADQSLPAGDEPDKP
ncbi:MAG: SMC-Scp complex subunit ScpB, partial [Thermoleophilia bacterium]|nr:SMC-Scp complex subunit ScpB [Thermoleophilia bacterium]